MFDFAQVREIIHALAEERPDYVDPAVNCTYADREEDAPSCIIGHALYKLGAPIYILREMDDEFNGSIEAVRHPFVRDNFDTETREYMRSVQRKQDNSYSWGDAVRYVDRDFTD